MIMITHAPCCVIVITSLRPPTCLALPSAKHKAGSRVVYAVLCEGAKCASVEAFHALLQTELRESRGKAKYFAWLSWRTRGHAGRGWTTWRGDVAPFVRISLGFGEVGAGGDVRT